MNKYLVTGGAGFIGSHLVERIIERGDYARVLDNFSTGTQSNLKFLEQVPKAVARHCQVIVGDIRDLETVFKAAEGVDYILHHAALSSVPDSVLNPALSNDINIGGSLNVLLAGRKTGVKKVVFASSSAIYSDANVSAQTEDSKLDVSSSPYALAKMVGEDYCMLFPKLYGLNTIALRYFNVYGPRQDVRSEYSAVIPKFIFALLNNQKPIIYGNGKQTRDFIFVDDVVEANLVACDQRASSGEAYNIGSGKALSITELLRQLAMLMDRQVDAIYADPRPGDARASVADISRAQKALGFKVKTNLEQGLARTVAWFQTGQG